MPVHFAFVLFHVLYLFVFTAEWYPPRGHTGLERAPDFSLVVVDDAYPGNGRPGWSAAGDLNGDGAVDVVSGGGGAIQWYEAPSWTRYPIDDSSTPGGNGGVVRDVDRDGDMDVVAALFESSVVWWENPGPTGVTGQWTRHVIEPDSKIGFNHDLIAADVDGDGEEEYVALYVADGGVVWYDVPSDPKADAWPRTTILEEIDDPFVGLAAGDLDGDSDLDIVISNHWYENDDPAVDDWTAREVFAEDVQNIFVYDIDGDGRNDVAGAQGFKAPGKLLWARAPASKGGSWAIETVASTLDGPENMWAGILDADGDLYLLTGEMGTSDGFGDDGSNIVAYRKDNPEGTAWTRVVLASDVGVSARLNPVDIDGDGDTDFTADGNAEDHIYLWRNDSGVPTGVDDVRDSALLFSVTPNPASDLIRVEFSADANADVDVAAFDIEIFDVLGRLVANPVAVYAGGGTQSVTVATSGFGSGLYFVVVSAGDRYGTTTVLVTR